VPFLAKWPGKVHPHSTTPQIVCLTDVMATCAALVHAPLPEEAAEDSFSFLPVLLGTDEEQPVRKDILHQTISLALAIREGPWKHLDHQGSGGNRYDRGELLPYALPEKEPDAPGQLYHLERDPGETTNLSFDYPDVARRLKAKLEQHKSSGHTRPRCDRETRRRTGGEPRNTRKEGTAS